MVTVLNHPLITHKLAIMRDEKTCTKDFSQQLDEIASLMAYEVSRDLPVKKAARSVHLHFLLSFFLKLERLFIL